MKLKVEYELAYYDGPVVFFGTLDDDPIYAHAVESADDDLRFEYWRLRVGNGTLAQRLSAPASGAFSSSDVEWKV